MRNFKKGDIVGRISYNKDVIFEIKNIIKMSDNRKLAILKGITDRIEADSYLEDLELIDKRTVNLRIKSLEDEMQKRIEKCLKEPQYCINVAKKIFGMKSEEKRGQKVIYTGKILHLDGDKRYAEKSVRYYKSLGLNVVVKNIPENKQALLVKGLLDRYVPDILIVTGHDGMIKKQTAYNDLYNYRNSKYFINTVNEARKWCSNNNKDLAIFARSMSKLL